MVMQKVWQWIRDRKTNSIRKWRSTFGVSTGASTSGEADGGQYFESLLDVPGGHLHPLHPIGGSDNALSMLRSEKIKRQQGSFLGRISRRLSPRNKSKKENYPEETNALLSVSVNGTLEHDNGDFLDSKKLFDSVHQCLSEIPTSSTPLDVSPKSEKSLLSGSLEDGLDADCKKMADELFKHSVSTSRLAKKRDSETKRERKRTRFIIPQLF
uniref:Uncharacterized protein n=1 Tax=Acrobeloides nanus TaxID=290746 RepID=A0A914C2E4_9BILA